MKLIFYITLSIVLFLVFTADKPIQPTKGYICQPNECHITQAP